MLVSPFSPNYGKQETPYAPREQRGPPGIDHPVIPDALWRTWDPYVEVMFSSEISTTHTPGPRQREQNIMHG